MRFAAVYMAEGLGKAGQVADAFDAIDDAIARAERTEGSGKCPSCCASKAGWASCRMRPHRLALPKIISGKHATGASAGRLSWELRAAVSLARLLRDQGRSAEALALSSRSTSGSPKGSTQPTSRWQEHLSTICDSPAWLAHAFSSG